MKKCIIFLLAVIPALVNAQTGRLINRIDHQVNKWHLITTSPQAAKSFNIAMHSYDVSLDSGNVSTLTGDISNLTATDTIKIVFNRTHLRLPQDWTSSVCFGTNCFASIVDSIPESNAFHLIPGKTAEFILNIYCSPSVMQADSVVDYIRFTSLSGNAGDTLSFTLKGVLSPESAVQDRQPKTISSHPSIKAIYPSPLVTGDAIKVKISSPRDGTLSYSIYDGVGRVVALGVTRQRLNLGDNTIGIGSLDGLANGSYMLKLNFADGSTDTRFFQVMR